MKKTCKNCKYWFQENDDYRCPQDENDRHIEHMGSCLRNAPTITRGMIVPAEQLIVEEEEYDSVWPYTRKWEWCGEFEQKGQKNQKHKPDEVVYLKNEAP